MEPDPLCLRPEVLDLCLFLGAIIDELHRKSRSGLDSWHEGEGVLVALYDAAISRLAAVGVTAELHSGKRPFFAA